MGRRSDRNRRVRLRSFEKWFNQIHLVRKETIKHLLQAAFSAGWLAHRDQNNYTGDFE